jgi:hypothetical protein
MFGLLKSFLKIGTEAKKIFSYLRPFPRIFLKKISDNARLLNILLIRTDYKPYKTVHKLLGIIPIWITKNGEKLKQIEERFPKIMSFSEMLQRIKNGASLTRFGDGEFRNMMNGNIAFQKSDEKLSVKLQYTLKIQSDNLIVAIPQFDINSVFWQKFWLKRWDYLSNYLADKIYGNSFFSRGNVFHELSVEEICEMWNGRDIVFIVPKNGRFIFEARLFSKIRSAEFINIPPKNAWFEYDKILMAAKKYPKDVLFFISAGPTGTALAGDLFILGYQALDMGHFPNCYLNWLGEAPTPEEIAMVRKS